MYLFNVDPSIQGRFDQAYRRFLYISSNRSKRLDELTSAWRFKLIGTRRNIPADMP